MKSMTSMMRVAALALAAAVLTIGSVEAADATSPALAKQLVSLMTERHLDTVAAPDPTAPDRYIAAMAFPDVQLLVVAARYPSPDYLKEQVAQKQYREVYTSLQSNPIQESKLFFQDLGADGLRGGGGDAADVMYERGTVQTILDGNWKKSKMNEAAYSKKFEDADVQYSKLLTTLIDALRAQP